MSKKKFTIFLIIGTFASALVLSVITYILDINNLYQIAAIAFTFTILGSLAFGAILYFHQLEKTKTQL